MYQSQALPFRHSRNPLLLAELLELMPGDGQVRIALEHFARGFLRHVGHESLICSWGYLYGGWRRSTSIGVFVRLKDLVHGGFGIDKGLQYARVKHTRRDAVIAFCQDRDNGCMRKPALVGTW